MTTLQLKVEIEKELDKLPEQTLPEVLEYIKKLQFDQKVDESVDRIFKENDELLRRLAQ